MVGVTVPLYSCEHMYIVTEKMEGVPRDLPVMRDPDGYIYFKEEVGGLLMGGFEPDAKPWNKDVIPDDFEFGMLPDDWDQFQILMENALIRVPALEKTGIKTFMNGPESFTPDLNYILGEAPELRASSSAPASTRWASPARAAPAWRWPNGSSPASRRSISGRSTSAASPASTATTPGCATASPRRWACTTRCRGRSASTRAAGRSAARRSTIASRRAAPGSAPRWAGSGRTGSPAPARRPTCSMAGAAAHWFDAVAAEHAPRARRVTVVDETSFGKFLVQGRDAEAVLQRLCANDIAVPVGRTVYTGLLNERGTFESDLTIARLARDKFLIVTGSAQATRDADWIGRHMPADAHAVLTDVTAAWTVLSVMGPTQPRAAADGEQGRFLQRGAFPSRTIREIDIGYATVLASRRTYMGELGWELYVPVEFAVTVFETLHEAGADVRPARCRLLRDRDAAPREGLSRLGPRADARRHSVPGRARLGGEARQAGRLHRPARRWSRPRPSR